jgi:hypothetical protein
LAVQLVLGVEEQPVVPRPDQLVELLLRQPAIEVDDLRLQAPFREVTPRLAAGGSSGFRIEPHGLQ